MLFNIKIIVLIKINKETLKNNVVKYDLSMIMLKQMDLVINNRAN